MTDTGSGAPSSEGLATLARLLHLARRARDVGSAAELGFIAVNETRDLVPYRQAVLWEEGRGAVALSGVVSPEANAPYLLWLKRTLHALAESAPAGIPTATRLFEAADLPADEATEWADWLPPHALWLPFDAAGCRGGWLLARDDAWSEAEVALLSEWIALWAQAWALRHVDMPQTHWRAMLGKLLAWRPRRQDFIALRSRLETLRERETWRQLGRWLWTTRRGRIVLGVAAVLLFPVRLSVLAPGQLVPADPAVIRSPMDGIVDHVLVQPNQHVKAGDALLEFDRITLTSRLEVARQGLATAETEYRQFAQQAVTDSKSKGQMAALQGRIEEKRAEAAYLDALNQRSMLTAPRDGIALIDEPAEWAGRPVTAGERIMMVADEHAAEIEAWLAPADMIELPEAASVTIYLNTRPLSPVDGRVRYAAHEAQVQPEGGYAYRLRAALAPGETAPRIGLKGSVKVSGHFVPLVYWVLRKPLAAARAFVGL
ncbi:MAG TPA: HlyD family efflux transporter periplasmic adaptor subunit [Rhodocyclaceae bacterium]